MTQRDGTKCPWTEASETVSQEDLSSFKSSLIGVLLQQIKRAAHTYLQAGTETVFQTYIGGVKCKCGSRFSYHPTLRVPQRVALGLWKVRAN